MILRYITVTVLDKEIGIQIKKARLEKEYSQEELGEKLGVTWEMISRYENGRSSSRKYITELAEILEKPVEYFFGKESSGQYNVEKLAAALREKGVGYSAPSPNKVVLVDDFAILGFERSLKLSRQYYSVPEWLIEKHADVFALRLSSVVPESIDVNKGDVGFFSSSLKPRNTDIVLVQGKNIYKLRRYSRSIKAPILAVLIVQEKRYR